MSCGDLIERARRPTSPAGVGHPYRFWPQLWDDLAGDDDLEHALEDAVHKIGGAGMTLLGEPLADRELCRLPLRGPRRP
jgi:hypothetical protein